MPKMTRDELLELREEALSAAAELRAVGFLLSAADVAEVARAADRELDKMDNEGDG